MPSADNINVIAIGNIDVQYTLGNHSFAPLKGIPRPMNQLALFLPESQALPALADAELEKATAIRRAYRSDFAIFAA